MKPSLRINQTTELQSVVARDLTSCSSKSESKIGLQNFSNEEYVKALEDRAITLTSQENWVTSLFAYRAKNASFDTTGKLALITSFSFDF